MDRRLPPRQVSQGGTGHRDAWPQCCLRRLRLSAGAGGLAGLECRRRGDLASCATGRAAGYRGQYAALRFGSLGGYLHRDACAIWQARRQPLRQRLAGWTGGLERLRRTGFAG